MRKPLDLVGQRFGKLEVLRFDHSSKRGKIYECKCDCGNYKLVSTGDLRNGKVVTCGCRSVRREANKNRAESYIGKKYGRLEVISMSREEINDGSYFATCKCDCGQIIKRRFSYIKYGSVQSCGCYHLDRLSELGYQSLLHNTRQSGKWVYNKNGRRIVMRSCYELMFADILDNRGVEWEYEPKIFKLADGVRYKPDFKVGDEWYEVKGYFDGASKLKRDLFVEQGNKLSLITIEDIEKEHPEKYRTYLKHYNKELNRALL